MVQHRDYIQLRRAENATMIKDLHLNVMIFHSISHTYSYIMK